MKISRPSSIPFSLSAAALACGFLLHGCSKPDAPGAEEGTSPTGTSSSREAELFGAAGSTEKPGQVGQNTAATLETLFGQGGAEPTEFAPVYPDLGFEEFSVGLPDTGSWREHPLLADLDGDGLDDLVASNREEDGLNVWLHVPGSGWVQTIEGIPRNLMYGGSDAADLDGDGRVDLIFASHKSTTRVFLNRPPRTDMTAEEGEPGAIHWEQKQDALLCTFLGLDVALGNLNGDEYLDAVTIAQFAVGRDVGGLGVYFGRGDGSFERQLEFSTLLGRSRNGHQVELTDLDGNGLDDLFVTAEWGLRVFMTHQDAETGEVQFEDRSQGLPVPPSIGNSLYAFIPCELTGAAPLEVAFAGLADKTVASGERNDCGAFRWTGETWVQIDEGLPRHLAFRDVVSDDFNADGHGDLLLSGPGAGVVLYLGDGTGKFTPLGMLAGTRAGGRLSVGDVDGDGRPDVAVAAGSTKARPEAGAVKVFLNRAAAFGE